MRRSVVAHDMGHGLGGGAPHKAHTLRHRLSRLTYRLGLRRAWWLDEGLGNVKSILYLQNRWSIEMMRLLDLDSSGLAPDGRSAYVRLRTGWIFYSFLPSEFQREVFHARREAFPANLEADAVNVAFDVVNRYMRENVGAWIPPISYHLGILGPDCFFLDAGAYLGYGALRIATLSRDSRILCIEADPRSYELLVRNINENGLADRIVALHCALSDHDDQVTLDVSDADGNRTGNVMVANLQDALTGERVSPSGRHPERVSSRAFDSLDVQHGFLQPDRPFLAHLGINGAEYLALRGMTNTLRKHRRYGIKVSTRYFTREDGPIHEKTLSLLSSIEGTTVKDVWPHVYAYRWSST